MVQGRLNPRVADLIGFVNPARRLSRGNASVVLLLDSPVGSVQDLLPGLVSKRSMKRVASSLGEHGNGGAGGMSHGGVKLRGFHLEFLNRRGEWQPGSV